MPASLTVGIDFRPLNPIASGGVEQAPGRRISALFRRMSDVRLHLMREIR